MPSVFGNSPSTTPIYPVDPNSLQSKAKLGAKLEIPGLFYNQYVPTAANLTSGTVTNSGLSLIGAHQLGTTTAGTLPLGGTAAVTFSSSSGLLASFTTSSFMPTTLNYDQLPVVITPAAGAVMPTGLIAGQVYYWQWVSATTGKFALTPSGTVIAYTDAGSGTLYCQAASAAVPGTGYWGSPWLPAGALEASEGIADTILHSGCTIRTEILGHATGTTTNVTTITPGLLSPTGTFTALTAGSALARVAAGPFPFKITCDLIVQQYNSTNAMIRGVLEYVVYSTTTTHTESMNIFAKTTSLDLTQPYAPDIRILQATPVVGEYIEPLTVRMWAFN
jgi:hypothetical protein